VGGGQAGPSRMPSSAQRIGDRPVSPQKKAKDVGNVDRNEEKKGVGIFKEIVDRRAEKNFTRHGCAGKKKKGIRRESRKEKVTSW